MGGGTTYLLSFSRIAKTSPTSAVCVCNVSPSLDRRRSQDDAARSGCAAPAHVPGTEFTPHALGVSCVILTKLSFPTEPLKTEFTCQSFPRGRSEVPSSLLW